MTNQAIIVFRWRHLESMKATALCRSSGVLYDCMDGITDMVLTVNRMPNKTCDVEMTFYIDITQSYAVPSDDITKATILADICQRLRGTLYTEGMNHRIGDILEGLITDVIVHRWDTNKWKLYDEDDMEDDIHE